MVELWPGVYEEELTDEDIKEWERKEREGKIVDDVPGGVEVSIPIRVDYLNGDYHKALEVIEKEFGDINKVVKYKTVQSVPPYHATIHVFPKYGVKVMKLLRENGIKMYKVKPTF